MQDAVITRPKSATKGAEAATRSHHAAEESSSELAHRRQRSSQQKSMRKEHMEIFEGEIAKLEDQIASIGGHEQGTMRALTLKKKRMWARTQKNKHILEGIHSGALKCIAVYCTDVWTRLLDMPSATDIRRQLLAQPDYMAHWQQLAALSDYGDAGMKLHIEDMKACLQKTEDGQLEPIIKEFAMIGQSLQTPAGTPRVYEADEAAETKVAVMAIERLQSDINRLVLHTQTNEDTFALKAAMFLKKKVIKMSQEMDTNVNYIDTVAGTTERKLAMPESTGWLEYEETDEQGRDEYVGGLLNECEHGLGTLLWVDGTQFAGEFCEGGMHGFGHEIYPDLSSYVGQFCKNMRHGMGVFAAESGDEYSGSWVEGERDGVGILRKTPGRDTKAVLALFQNGDLVEILKGISLVDGGPRLSGVQQLCDRVVRRAIENAGHAETLAFEIKRQYIEGNQHEKIEGVAPAPQENLRSWLATFGLGRAASAIQLQGFGKPVEMLRLLMDQRAYNHVVTECALTMKEAVVLRNALENLDVNIIPKFKHSGASIDVADGEMMLNASSTGSYDDLHSWLATFGMGRSTKAIQAQGVVKPADMLTLLTDEKEYQIFATRCCLTGQEARIICNALENLHLILSSRTTEKSGFVIGSYSQKLKYSERRAAAIAAAALRERRVRRRHEWKEDVARVAEKEAERKTTEAVVRRQQLGERQKMDEVEEKIAARELQLCTAEEEEEYRKLIEANAVRLLYMTRKIEFDEKARVREKFRAMRLACALLQHFGVFFIRIWALESWRNATRQHADARKALQAAVRRFEGGQEKARRVHRVEIEKATHVLQAAVQARAAVEVVVEMWRLHCCILLQAAMRRIQGQEERRRRELQRERDCAACVLQVAVRGKAASEKAKLVVHVTWRLDSAVRLQAAVRCIQGQAERRQRQLHLTRHNAAFLLQNASRLKFAEGQAKWMVYELRRHDGAAILQAAVRCKHGQEERRRHERQAVRDAAALILLVACRCTHAANEAKQMVMARWKQDSAEVLQAAVRCKRSEWERRRWLVGVKGLQACVRRNICTVCVPPVLTEARLEQNTLLDQAVQREMEAMAFVTGVTDDMFMSRGPAFVEVQLPGNTSGMIPRLVFAELREIQDIHARRAEKRMAMRVARNVEVMKRDITLRNVREQEAARLRLAAALEQLRMEEIKRTQAAASASEETAAAQRLALRWAEEEEEEERAKFYVGLEHRGLHAKHNVDPLRAVWKPVTRARAGGRGGDRGGGRGGGAEEGRKKERTVLPSIAHSK